MHVLFCSAHACSCECWMSGDKEIQPCSLHILITHIQRIYSGSIIPFYSEFLPYISSSGIRSTVAERFFLWSDYSTTKPPRLDYLSKYFRLSKKIIHVLILPFLPITLSTSNQISPSFQGNPTIFHKGIFLKQTPPIKNWCALRELQF